MCEFKVMLEDREIMRDVIYAQQKGDDVIIKILSVKKCL